MWLYLFVRSRTMILVTIAKERTARLLSGVPLGSAITWSFPAPSRNCISEGPQIAPMEKWCHHSCCIIYLPANRCLPVIEETLLTNEIHIVHHPTASETSSASILSTRLSIRVGYVLYLWMLAKMSTQSELHPLQKATIIWASWEQAERG